MLELLNYRIFLHVIKFINVTDDEFYKIGAIETVLNDLSHGQISLYIFNNIKNLCTISCCYCIALHSL